MPDREGEGSETADSTESNERDLGINRDDIAFGEEDSAESSSLLKEEPIPDSVKPLPEGSNLPAHPEDVIRPEASLSSRMTGYAAALVILITVFSAGFMFKHKIVTAWPPAMLIYDLAGIPVVMKGEGLIIESFSASLMSNKDSRDVLVLKGRVINLTDHPIEVPPMLAVLRSTNGEDGDIWTIDPPVDQVEPGASFAFKSDYPDVPGGVGSVNLTFSPLVVEASLAAGKQHGVATEALGEKKKTKFSKIPGLSHD